MALKWTPERAAALTGIPAEEIAALAREYATTKPAAIRLNYGIQRSERGGAAVRAVLALAAITARGRTWAAAFQLSTSQAFQFDRKSLEMPELQKRSTLRSAKRAS